MFGRSLHPLNFFLALEPSNPGANTPRFSKYINNSMIEVHIRPSPEDPKSHFCSVRAFLSRGWEKLQDEYNKYEIYLLHVLIKFHMCYYIFVLLEAKKEAV